MKNANKIINTFYNTKTKEDQKIKIVATKIIYEDGTEETFTTTCKATDDKIPAELGKVLEQKINNYNMLIHDTEKWISYRNYIIDEVNLRYLDGDIVNTQEDIIKAKDIEISYIEDSNMAIITVTDKKGEEDSFTCDKDNVEDVLYNKIDNYKRLAKKGKIRVTEHREETKEENTILNINYIVGKNIDEDYAEVTYIDEQGNQHMKETSIEDANSMLYDYKLEDKKEKVVNYYERIKNEQRDLTEKEFYVIYNRHVSGKEDYAERKDAKEEPSVNARKNNNPTELTKVVFYKFKDKNNKDRIKTLLIYNNGATRVVNRKEGILSAISIADEYGIKEEDYQDLLDAGVVVTTSGEELKQNFGKYIRSAQKGIPLEKPTAFGKVSNFFKKIGQKIKKNVKKVIALAVAAVTVITGASILGKNSNKNKVKDIPQTTKVMQDSSNKNNTIKTNNESENTIEYNTTFDILNILQNKNESRYNFLNNVSKTLLNYNINEANNFLEEDKDTKISHTFEEMAIEYLTYNDISVSELHDILGDTFLDRDTLIDTFKKSVKQDALAHNIQTSNIDKSDMFTTQEGKDFYNKYNELFTKMNNSEEKVEKQKYVKEFYSMLREDFKGMENNNYNDIESYKLCIKEFLPAMQHMNITAGNELNETEQKYMASLQEVIINNKLSGITTTQNARAYVDPEFGEVDNLPNIEEFGDMLTEELADSSNEYKGEELRNVRNYDSYKEHINGTGNLKNIDEVTEETVSNTTDNYSNNSNNNTYTNVDYPEESYEPHSVVVEDDENTNSDEETNNNETIPEEDRVPADDNAADQIITSEDQEKADDNAADQIIVDDNDNNSEDNTNPGIEDDDSLSLDDFISSDDQITSNDTVIDYDDSVSTDGALNDNYTNETTNGSDAVTPDTALPDPNTDSMQSLSNEALADMLVESMASYPVEESGVVYTMHL